MPRHLYLRNVATLKLDEEKCTGCGMCLTVCPHAVFARHNGRARIDDLDACMECGACARNCPEEAVTVKAGVGCATAVMNSMLGRNSSSCCCVIDPDKPSAGDSSSGQGGPSGPLSCC